LRRHGSDKVRDPSFHRVVSFKTRRVLLFDVRDFTESLSYTI
jgi:hypothetical protein